MKLKKLFSKGLTGGMFGLICIAPSAFAYNSPTEIDRKSVTCDLHSADNAVASTVELSAALDQIVPAKNQGFGSFIAIAMSEKTPVIANYLNTHLIPLPSDTAQVLAELNRSAGVSGRAPFLAADSLTQLPGVLQALALVNPKMTSITASSTSSRWIDVLPFTAQIAVGEFFYNSVAVSYGNANFATQITPTNDGMGIDVNFTYFNASNEANHLRGNLFYRIDPALDLLKANYEGKSVLQLSGTCH